MARVNFSSLGYVIRLLVLISLGMLIVGFLFPAFLRPLICFQSGYIPPEVIRGQSKIKTADIPGEVGCFDIGLKLTFGEISRIERCVSNFSIVVDSAVKVDRPKMEVDRVKSHSYLGENSRVFEVGGYTGVDADKLINLYKPYYYALEPVPRFFKLLNEKFKNNTKVTILRFGLGKTNKKLTINADTDATSLFRNKPKSKDTETEEIIIREAKEFFTEMNVQTKPVDLMSINCEGCEYELLEVLISQNLVSCFKNIQFQFHINLPGIQKQECRYCQIMELLLRTHRPVFQYSYTWQSWRLKDL